MTKSKLLENLKMILTLNIDLNDDSNNEETNLIGTLISSDSGGAEESSSGDMSQQSASQLQLSPSNKNHLSLQSIFSATELVRKKHAIEHQKKNESNQEAAENAAKTPDSDQTCKKSVPDVLNMSDDESDLVMSGLGNVSKDCAQEDLMDWSEILGKWRKATWNERPKGLQSLVRKGRLRFRIFEKRLN